MSTPQPFAPMMQVYAVLESIVRHRLSCTPKESIPRLRDSFRQAMAHTRQYVVSNPEDLELIWRPIRSNPVALDFVMEVTAQLAVALAGSTMPFETVTQAMAQAYGMHNNDERHGKVIDQNLYQRLPTRQTAESLMRANGWYVTLLLIQHRSDMIYND